MRVLPAPAERPGWRPKERAGEDRLRSPGVDLARSSGAGGTSRQDDPKVVRAVVGLAFCAWPLRVPAVRSRARRRPTRRPGSGRLRPARSANSPVRTPCAGPGPPELSRASTATSATSSSFLAGLSRVDVVWGSTGSGHSSDASYHPERGWTGSRARSERGRTGSTRRRDPVRDDPAAHQARESCRSRRRCPPEKPTQRREGRDAHRRVAGLPLDTPAHRPPEMTRLSGRSGIRRVLPILRTGR